MYPVDKKGHLLFCNIDHLFMFSILPLCVGLRQPFFRQQRGIVICQRESPWQVFRRETLDQDMVDQMVALFISCFFIFKILLI